MNEVGERFAVGQFFEGGRRARLCSVSSRIRAALRSSRNVVDDVL